MFREIRGESDKQLMQHFAKCVLPHCQSSVIDWQRQRFELWLLGNGQMWIIKKEYGLCYL
jgi:hypothetical protein